MGRIGKELPSVDLHQIKTCHTEETDLGLNACQPSQGLSDKTGSQIKFEYWMIFKLFYKYIPYNILECLDSKKFSSFT